MDRYSCICQNSAGDTIFRMLRDDAPYNAIQEQYAERIVKACNEYDKLKEQADKGIEWFNRYKESEAKYLELFKKTHSFKTQNKLLLEALKLAKFFMTDNVSHDLEDAANCNVEDAFKIVEESIKICEPLT